MKNKPIIGIVLMAFLAISCKKDNNNGIELGAYPLSLGNEWEYDYELNITGTNDANNNMKYQVRWRVEADTVIKGEAAKKVLIIETGTTARLLEDSLFVYYINKKDGLYAVGTSNHSTVVRRGINFLSEPEAKQAYWYEELRDKYTSFVLPGPAKVKANIYSSYYKQTNLPVKIGNPWIANDYVFAEKRVWLGYEDVLTTVGTFRCAKLQVFLDNDKDNKPDPNTAIIYQYFSDKGLVKEEFIQKGAEKIEIKSTAVLTKLNF